MAKKVQEAPVKMTKTMIEDGVMSLTGLSRKDVKAVISALSEVVVDALSAQKLTKADKNGPKIAVLPGKLSIYKSRRPATKARVGMNPATGEQIEIAAKPARIVIKAFVHRALKDEA